MDDADLPAAAEAARVGAFLGAGQSCSAAERLLVHEAVRDEFVELLAAEVAQARSGSATRSTTPPRWARSTTSRAPPRWTCTWRTPSSAAPRVVTGGSRAGGLPDRASTGSRPCSTTCRPTRSRSPQETFGPIAPIVPIASLEQAIEQTNAQSYGLMAAIFTADLAAGMRYADSVHMGLVNINETTNYWEPHLPWGGRRPLGERDRPRRRRAPDGHPHRAPDRPL